MKYKIKHKEDVDTFKLTLAIENVYDLEFLIEALRKNKRGRTQWVRLYHELTDIDSL